MSYRKHILIVLSLILMILALGACGEKEKPEEIISDQLFREKKYGEVVYIFQMDDETFMIDPAYKVSFYEDNLENGHFYELTADITYLNGGIAGYVNYPEIDNIIATEEISPFELNIPDITKNRYGLSIIGDYAEGDIFLYEYGEMAVWKDGEWIWFYDKTMDGEDGTLICFRNNVSEEQIKEGIASGVLSCGEYFVLPKIS